MSTEPETSQDNKDTSPYIRTFAKDYEKLSGKAPEKLQRSTPIPQKKSAKAKHERKSRNKSAPITDGATESDLKVVSGEIDARAQIQKDGVPLPEAKEPADSISLPRIAPGDIVAGGLAPNVPTPPAPEMEASAPIQMPTPSEASSEIEAEDRAAILARLKARVENLSPETTPEVPVVEVPQPPEPVAEPVPTPVVVPIEVPIPTPPAPPIESANMMPRQDQVPSPLHTYTSDFADRIDEKQASKFTVLAAEKDAPTQRPAAPKKSRPNTALFAILGGVLLIILGAGLIYAAYSFLNKNAPVQIISGPPTLIRTDSQVKLIGTGPSLMNALAQQASEPLAENDVLLTYVDESTTTAQGVTEQQATGGDFITQLNLQAPDILIRNIDPSSMVGIVHAGNETRPFFVLRVTSYERTFAGMLEWEPTMLTALSELYPLYPAPAPQIISEPVSVSTTSSSTSTGSAALTSPVIQRVFVPMINPVAPAKVFVDEIVDNHSARALKDNAGQTIVLYGYADTQTLIIARDEAAFTLLLGKLQASGN